MRNRFAATCIIFSALWAAACGPGPATVSQLSLRLDGRGPVLLADGNDYLPADAFLKEQRASSPELSDFVERHGEPTAISLERKLYRASRLSLFYPSENKRYVFSRWSSDWGLVGPEPIDSEDRASLDAQMAQAGQTVGKQASAISPQRAERVPAAPVTANEPPRIAQAPLGHQELRGRLKAPQEAQEARLQRLPNGDYRHRVTFRGETLKLLAEWYTEDAKNAAALAKASQRALTAPLRVGDEITIPRRLMRNVQALPEAGVGS